MVDANVIIILQRLELYTLDVLCTLFRFFFILWVIPLKKRPANSELILELLRDSEWARDELLYTVTNMIQAT